MPPDNQIAFFLTGESLVIFGGRVDQDKFIFPPGAVQSSEVIDREKFKIAFEEFLENAALKQDNVIVILSDDLVFTKKEKVAPEMEKEFKDSFLNSVPHPSQNVSFLTLRNGKNLELFAADKTIYGLIVDALLEKGIKVYSVLPVEVLEEISNTKEPEQTEVLKALKDTDVVNEYNFLEKKIKEEKSVPVGEVEKKSKKIWFVYLLVGLLLFGLACLYLLSNFGMLTNPFTKKAIKPVQKQQIATTSEIPSASPVLKTDKATLKIDILNGSGIAGQAGKLSESLKAIGFQNIQIGNTEATSGATQVDFKSDVQKDLINQITAELKKSLTNVATKEATLSSDFDVVITTAK